MNIPRLKSIVNDLETNYSLVAGSKPATADLLVLFGMSIDKWLVSEVRNLGGDTATVERGNETGLEAALHSVMVDREDTEYYFDGVTEIPNR